MAFRPGEIYYSHDFYGSGRHRVVILSRENLNRGEYVVAAMFTSQRLDERRLQRNCVFFGAGTQNGLDVDCVVQAESISQMPWRYLDLQAGVLGVVDDEKMAEVILAVEYVIDAHDEPD